MKSRKKYNDDKPITEIYQEILDGKRIKMPKESWNLAFGGYENFKGIIRYLVLQRLNFNKQDVHKINGQFMNKWKLRGGFLKLFNESTFDAISYCFPEWNVQPWECKVVPMGYWTEENLSRAIRWYCEKNDFKRDDIPKELNHKNLFEAGISIKQRIDSLYELACIVYPEYDFKVWEFYHSKKWNDDRVFQAIDWLISEQLKFTYDEIIHQLTRKHFDNNGLKKVMYRFGGSPYRAMKFAYPDKDWELLRDKSLYVKKGKRNR